MATLSVAYSLIRWSLIRCSLFAIRCSLFAGRCSLIAVRCSLVAVRWSLLADRCSLFAGRGSLVAARWSRFAVRSSQFAGIEGPAPRNGALSPPPDPSDPAAPNLLAAGSANHHRCS
jgi:hypothetical protein